MEKSRRLGRLLLLSASAAGLVVALPEVLPLTRLFHLAVFVGIFPDFVYSASGGMVLMGQAAATLCYGAGLLDALARSLPMDLLQVCRTYAQQSHDLLLSLVRHIYLWTLGSGDMCHALPKIDKDRKYLDLS